MLVAPEKIKADYKIEIHFGKGRTLAGPNTAAMMFFDSGKQMNGDGDGLLYVCQERDKGLDVGHEKTKNHKQVIKGRLGCGGIIPNERVAGGVAVCPHCNNMIKSDELTSAIFYRTTTDTLAEILVGWYNKLNQSADIYLKYHPEDLRVKAMQDAFGMEAARKKRGLTIYPLKNIIKDVSAGASLKTRFKALLQA